MFTGIIEEMGQIRRMRRRGTAAMELMIGCRKVLEGTRIGDSIAVNGICLTVTQLEADGFTADVMPETMAKTDLKEQREGSWVNLERALAVGERMGGHFVQGHVDGLGRIMGRDKLQNAVIFRIGAPRDLTKYMVEKGSIAVNGISLTLVEVGAEEFTVSVIPHTLTVTQLQTAQMGDLVNIECDMIGKYVAKLLGEVGATSEGLQEKLKRFGFS